ncbi:MAG: zf-HC2 domain-containing protein [Chloroflexi bacterium]|nr:zf-HC2 domain-containing protein [Chloroflexota bacterium]
MKSLDCTDIKALLSALIDDCVESDTRHLAERHLADCKSCRTLIDEAEAAEAMVAASVGDLAPLDTLPDGFKANVLARTVYADENSNHPQRWTTWLGWLAAAASLALALTIWVVDNSGNLSSPKSTVARNDAPENDIALADNSPQGSTNIHPVNNSRASFVGLNSMSMMPASLRSSISSPKSISPISMLTLDEIEALDQTVLLLEMFIQAPEVSQTLIKSIRNIAEYDELLPKLSKLRAKLAQKDRSNTYAAELLLQRIIYSPLEIQDVQEMRSAIGELNLLSQLEKLASYDLQATSL